MSRLLILLAFVLAPAVSAQSVLSDTTSIYVIPHVGLGISSDGQATVLGAIVGHRVSERVDLGLRLDIGDASDAGSALFVAVGTQVGISGHLGSLDTALRLGSTLIVGERVIPTDARGVQTLDARAEWTLARSFTSGTSLRLAPVVGVYGAVCATRNQAPAGAGCAELGTMTGFEIGFRAFGADVAVPLTVRHRVAGNQAAASASSLGLLEGTVSSGIRMRF